MQDIEPFYAWRNLYIASEDERSPFYQRQYSEFEYSNAIYNFLIHPQWDDIDSPTLYIKILMVDYDNNFAIIEMIGEWNDCINNDIMILKRDVIDSMFTEHINKFILITENVLNFHSGDKDYYEEWFEEVTDEGGWVVALNMPEQTQYDFKKKKLNYYVELMEMPTWRVYKPQHLFEKIDGDLSKRLD